VTVRALADEVLDTDHSAQIARGLRGFTGDLLIAPGVPPYAAVPHLGKPIPPARGCNNSYMGISAPWLWPDAAREWYAVHETHYWDEQYGIAGFREFMPGDESEWYVDVDSGPVVAGFGVSASAFGLGAARTNGRFDHAYPLALEMIATSWVLPWGTLWAPRLMSHAADAPYLGEAAILYNLAHPTAPNFPITTGGSIPPYVYGWIAFYFGLCLLVVVVALRSAGQALFQERDLPRWPRTQAGIFAALVVASSAAWFWGHSLQAMAMLLLALTLPRIPRAPGNSGTGLGECSQSK
jgi:hypothetical protein